MKINIPLQISRLTNFKKIKLIEKNQIKFINPNNFENNLSLNKNKKKFY